jgi:hypothetical protein
MMTVAEMNKARIKSFTKQVKQFAKIESEFNETIKNITDKETIEFIAKMDDFTAKNIITREDRMQQIKHYIKNK